MEQLHVHVYLYIYTFICIYACVCIYVYIYIYTYIYLFMYLFIYLSIYRYRRDFSKGMALAFGGMLVVSEECRAFWGLPKLEAIYTASCSRKCCVLFTEMLRSFRHVFCTQRRYTLLLARFFQCAWYVERLFLKNVLHLLREEIGLSWSSMYCIWQLTFLEGLLYVKGLNLKGNR